MKFTYSVYKVIKVDGGSDIDGKYFIGGGLDYDVAVGLAENLSVIDIQMAPEVFMCDMKIKFIVIKEYTNTTVKTFKV